MSATAARASPSSRESSTRSEARLEENAGCWGKPWQKATFIPIAAYQQAEHKEVFAIGVETASGNTLFLAMVDGSSSAYVRATHFKLVEPEKRWKGRAGGGYSSKEKR